jgi:predicted NUDIX family NTP pyrophosphohydrolase
MEGFGGGEDEFWYPIGQPSIVKGHELPGGPFNIDPNLLYRDYRGLAKVFIVPPPKNTPAGRTCFGSIPYRKKDGTSAYPLCRTCFEENNHRQICRHERDEERGMLVSLPTCEIFEACSKFGYKLATVYEVRSDRIVGFF